MIKRKMSLIFQEPDEKEAKYMEVLSKIVDTPKRKIVLTLFLLGVGVFFILTLIFVSFLLPYRYL